MERFCFCVNSHQFRGIIQVEEGRTRSIFSGSPHHGLALALRHALQLICFFGGVPVRDLEWTFIFPGQTPPPSRFKIARAIMAAKKGLLERGSHVINLAMENFFGNLGYQVGHWPRLTICCCLIFTVGCGAGFTKFVMVSDPEEMFTPAKAIVLDDDQWSTWFQELPSGVPDQSRNLLSWKDTQVGAEGRKKLAGGDGVATGMDRQLEMYGFKPDHFFSELGEDHPYSRLLRGQSARGGAIGGGESQRRHLVDYGEQKVRSSS